MAHLLRNVVQRNRIFHFRRVIPLDLRPRFGRREITCSLRTSELHLAGIRARRLYLAAESLFEESRDNPMLTDDQLAAIVQDFYAHVLAEENKLRLRLGRIPEEVRTSRAEHFGQIAAQARADLGANEFGSVSFITQAMMRKHKLEGQLDETQTRQLAQSLMRGGIDLAEAVQARYAGDFNFEPRDKLLARKVEAVFNPPPLPPKETTTADGQPLFGVVAAAFVTKQKQLRRWENQTAGQNEKSYELFKAICGDRPLSAYQRKDAARFKDQLERLPADYGKAAIYARKSPAEILEIDAASGGKAERLSIRTVKRHVSALSSLWDESIPQGAATDKIFAGFKFPAQQRAQDQRPMWRRSDLAKLFRTPVWSGCKSEGRRSTAGGLVIRDEKFWLPLIAVFSGARQEEICQLHVEDIRQEQGIWLFDINMKPPRKLKNKSAVRLVPIHPELIRLGLLGYVEQQRKAGQVRIFPNLHPGGADGRLGHGFTKWFTRYRRDVEVYEEGRDFHSFRHSATTFLHQGRVADSIVDRLTGHTTPGETARYTKETDLGQLKAAIDTIDIEVDFGALYET
ncbi:site-specific integrase [Bosea sp. ASV33]|uniref:site-specific integrase n=1 Tax=Bosea sp. ASV33 TaxID=2795106 RepID=UPI0020BFF537|nr:site-specific integrase [Bosea sp. ASV33]